MQRRGQARRDKVHATGAGRVTHLQWQLEQRLLRVDADQCHQAQRFAVGAQQDVLAVVQILVIGGDAPRPSAQHARGLEQGDAMAGAGQLHRRRTAGPATADDGGRAAGNGSRFSHERKSSTPATVCG